MLTDPCFELSELDKQVGEERGQTRVGYEEGTICWTTCRGE